MKNFYIRLICYTLIIFCFFETSIFATETEEGNELTLEEIEEVTNSVGAPKVYSKVVLLYDKTYEKVLYEKNGDLIIPNASTTKILTAIVAYENGDINDIVTVSKRAASIGGSTINLRSGDKVTLDDLIKGMLVRSGNDAAICVAEHIGGSVENFCDMMNKRAIELGAKNTHFVTPHGLDKDEHYTTANDLLIFANYLLDIPYLAEIVNMSQASLKINDYRRDINTTNEMLGIYEEANGIKTGFTNKAGRCLVTSMTKDDRTLISIVLGAETKKQRTSDSIALLNYGYKEFVKINLYENMIKHFELNVMKSNNKYYEVHLTGDEFTVLPLNKYNITYEYDFVETLYAPVSKGTVIGKINIYSNGVLEKVLEIKLPQDIKRKKLTDYIIELMRKQAMYINIKI